MNFFKPLSNLSTIFLTIALFLILIYSQQVFSATSPDLGTASSYSVLAGSAVTNTGTSTISGDVGISPGTVLPNYTGFGTVTLGGSIHDADGAALIAMNDKNTAYNALSSQSCDTDYGAVTKDLAGENLVPGVYCAGSFHLTGTLILNGSASDVWIFKSASDLVLTGGSVVKILFTGGGQPCNVWWRVASTATFDDNSTLAGNILADTSITLGAGATLNGRALARTAEVSLSSNSITGPTCDSTSDSDSDSSDSNSGSTTISAPPAKYCPPLTYETPIIIESKRTSPTSVSLNWGPYSGIDTFIVRYGFTNGDWAYNTFVQGFSTTINALPANQPIWVQVATTDSCSIGTYGEAKLIGGPGLPNTGFAPRKNNSPSAQ